ncbi:TPA: hypothetical protein UM343_003061 [Stenotrophomonas maltophilia]|nr:hypothetical protein [Stenotrophomonas maltophilia]
MPDVKLSQLAAASAASVAAGAGLWTMAGHILGLRMEYVGPASIRVSSGSAWIPSLQQAIEVPAALTLSGLTLAASTWYHLYLYLNGSTPAIEAVTAAPATPYSGTARAKTSDNTRRYIGSFRTNASGQILKFAHSGGQVSYAGNVSQQLVFNGNPAVPTTVDLSGYCPITSQSAQLLVLNQSPVNMYVGYANGPVAGDNSWITFLPGNSAQKLDAPYPATGDNLQVCYSTASSNGSLAWVAGYTYGR